MTEFAAKAFENALTVTVSMAPVTVMVLFFYGAVLRRKIHNPKVIATGFVFVLAGIWLILTGMDAGVYSAGETMAMKFADPSNRLTALLFAFIIGYSTTMAEPSLIAVSHKVEELSGLGLKGFALRNAVSLGVGFGMALGVTRIFYGGPLWVYIVCGYATVAIFTFTAPKEIVPLAYDAGGVTTSTVTVPVIFAMGLGLAQGVPGRSMMLDGFGLIAMASMFPIMALLGYASFVKLVYSIK
ncbi:MAG: DUF1538 domain-containing protein [Nitrospinae bacterium]|nr:DUF1538 domain-containing protein [Nitrospinota bacterium]